MAVLIEAISVVVRLETIADKYPGGVEQYVSDCPNNTLCMDKDITSVRFMTSGDANNFINGLVRDGLRCVTDGEYDEIAVVDQFDGFCMPCDWLDFTNSAGSKNIKRISACKIKGGPVDCVSTPPEWHYETSLSKWAIHVNEDELARITLLRREGHFDVYMDRLTGKELYCQRNVNRNLNS